MKCPSGSVPGDCADCETDCAGEVLRSAIKAATPSTSSESHDPDEVTP